MKKITKITVLILALALTLCACQKKETDEFSYSKGLDKDGFWAGIKATDYVTLADYKNYKVPEEAIQKEIDAIMSEEQYMKRVEVLDKEIQFGDRVNIDYLGTVDGEEFAGGSTNGQGAEVIIGVTNYIDGFLEQLIGCKPGDSLDVNVTFPENYATAELAGKDAVFTTRINYILEYEPYEVSDNFVMGVLNNDFGWQTVEDMNSGIRGYLIENYLFDNSTFKDEMPEIIRTQFVDRMVHEIQQTAASYGIEVDSFISYAYASRGVSNLAEFKAEIEKDANSAAENYILFQAIAETEGIKLTDADLLQYYEDNGMGEHVAEALSFYGEPFIKSMALYERAMEYIRSFGK